MIILGIDPGKKGAGVFLNEQGEYLSHFLMPMNKKELDYNELFHCIGTFYTNEIIVYLESLTMPFPGSKGSKGTYLIQGQTWGIIRGLLYGREVKTKVIHPKTWTSQIHKNQPKGVDSKDKSYRVFTQELCLDPQKVFGEKSKCKIEGLIDAYLIALYGLKMEGR